MQIRHMVLEDAEAVASLMLARRNVSYTACRPAGVDAASLSADMIRPHSESFVAVAADGRITGYAYARIRRGALWLDRLLAPADDRSQAANLVGAVIANYVGDAAISVAVDTGDADTVGFFEDLGFIVAADASGEGKVVLRRLISRA